MAVVIAVQCAGNPVMGMLGKGGAAACGFGIGIAGAAAAAPSVRYFILMNPSDPAAVRIHAKLPEPLVLFAACNTVTTSPFATCTDGVVHTEEARLVVAVLRSRVVETEPLGR